MTAAALRPIPSIALLVALSACGVGRPPEPVGAGPAPGSGAAVDSIVLERTLCYGTCPAYRLSLAGTGRVGFESRNPGDSGRTATDSVPPAVVAELLVEAEALGFFGLPDEIAADSSLCPDRATDHPTATVTIHRSAGMKRVEDYGGCYAATDHSVVPVVRRLRAFETAIDSAAGSARWVRPARGR
jgi:hypothetical protein